MDPFTFNASDSPFATKWLLGAPIHLNDYRNKNVNISGQDSKICNTLRMIKFDLPSLPKTFPILALKFLSPGKTFSPTEYGTIDLQDWDLSQKVILENPIAGINFMLSDF